jgi:FAD/FMN-containing dehydrogenase/Fe-S oxidoreductase
MLEERLARAVRGEVMFDAGSRARYATDASIYEVTPRGVLVPATDDDVRAAFDVCGELGVPVLARGAGSSQCGQTVGDALVIDHSKRLDRVLDIDLSAGTVTVEPGVVLDALNAHLKRHGVWFPVDVSTSAQATLGGMAGNNSCGSRSLAYGNMVHNVLAIDARLADGTEARFGSDEAMRDAPPRIRRLVERLRAIGAREKDEIARVVPKMLRRVGGYNADVFNPQSVRPYTGDGSVNFAQLLVGSEGTLAWTRSLTLRLAPLPAHRTLGVLGFDTLHDAMDATRHLVALAPSAVELVDRTMIDLALANPAFRDVMAAAIVGAPQAILLVEFIGDDAVSVQSRLDDLEAMVGDLALAARLVKLVEPARQRSLWDVRKAGLNIMMSAKGDAKPVSFIEDCAVPLEHLGEYVDRLTAIFARHGTRGTWYAHASVGTLHVRPILDMRTDGALKMRAIAEEAAALVRTFKGAFSGEHGDGLVRSEWVAWQFGPRLTRAFEEIKALFDPAGMLNPGKIVHAGRMDDATLFRFPPGRRTLPVATALDWSAWDVTNDPATGRVGPPGSGGDPARGYAKAVEMCNNNGHCRKFDAGTMCPSYRATKDEAHLTRGRANTLRHALAGRFGATLAAVEVRDALELCVGCKGCRRECPTGVDMSRMKIEFLHQWHSTHAAPLRDRLVASLPHWAPLASRVPALFNLRDRVPGLARIVERVTGISRHRSLPRWRRDTFLRDHLAGAHARVSGTRMPGRGAHPRGGGASADADARSVLFADCFTDRFEPENARAAMAVLKAAGCAPAVALPCADDAEPARPLCCGRTYLAHGRIDEARAEALRLCSALAPWAEAGVPIVGLEPSCVLTLRDEYAAMRLPAHALRAASNVLLVEEFLVGEHRAGRLDLPLARPQTGRALVHTHCHQKALDAADATLALLRLIPGLEVAGVEASCCGMAGAFGYATSHYDVSMRMGELVLLPAVRAAGTGTVVVAQGTSCRHQIADGTRASRRVDAVHAIRVVERAVAAAAAAAAGPPSNAAAAEARR